MCTQWEFVKQLRQSEFIKHWEILLNCTCCCSKYLTLWCSTWVHTGTTWAAFENNSNASSSLFIRVWLTRYGVWLGHQCLHSSLSDSRMQPHLSRAVVLRLYCSYESHGIDLNENPKEPRFLSKCLSTPEWLILTWRCLEIVQNHLRASKMTLNLKQSWTQCLRVWDDDFSLIKFKF